MKVRSVMTTPVEWCTPSADLGIVAMMMWQQDCAALPVVDETTRHVVGIVTERDICIAGAQTSRPLWDIRVEHVMTLSADTCRADEDIVAAFETMRDRRVQRLAVLDEGGHLVGMLTLADMILEASLAQGSEASRSSLPPLDELVALQRTTGRRRPPAERSGTRSATTV